MNRHRNAKFVKVFTRERTRYTVLLTRQIFYPLYTQPHCTQAGNLEDHSVNDTVLIQANYRQMLGYDLPASVSNTM